MRGRGRDELSAVVEAGKMVRPIRVHSEPSTALTTGAGGTNSAPRRSVEKIEDALGMGAGDGAAELIEGSTAEVGHTAELAEQLRGGARTDSGDVQQPGTDARGRAAVAVEGDRKAVGFVADLLHQSQDGRVAVEAERIVLLAVHVNGLFALGDAGQRQVDDLEFFEGSGGGVELADAAVNQHQPRKGAVRGLHAGIAALDGFAQAAEVVVAMLTADDELPVGRLEHPAVLPDDQGGHGIGALEMRNVETLDALGGLREAERGFQCFGDGLRAGLLHPEALLEGLPRVALHQIEEGALGAAQGRKDFQPAAGAFAKKFFQGLVVLEFQGHVDVARQIAGLQVELLEQGREEFRRLEFLEVFPVKIAAVQDASAADVEQVDGHQGRFGVPGQDVGVVAFGGGDFLFFFELAQGAQDVAVPGGLFEAFIARCAGHTLLDADEEIAAPSVEKHTDVAGRFGVARVADQTGNAGAEAALDVVLKAGPGVRAGEVHATTGHQEALVDEVHQAVRQAVGEIGAEVERAVFDETPGDVNAREFLAGGEADEGVGLVVAQQHVEFGLVQLDQMVFERQGLLVVVHDDVVHVGNFASQGASLGVLPAGFQEVGTHAAAQGFGLADVNDAVQDVFEQIDARRGGQGGDFLLQFHGAG